MADHLLIGVLVGIGSGIVALIVIGATTLHRFDTNRKADSVRVHRTLADLHRTVRVEMAAVRRDLADVAVAQERHAETLAAHLTTLTGEAVRALREHPLPALADLAESQEHRLTALAGELARMSEVMAADAAGHAKDLRNELLESLRMTLDEFRAAHAAQVEQVRTAVDENLERTIERRLGESFRLISERLEVVSDRLDHVHRGLGEVQSFAAGLGHLQRAVATVQLSGAKTGAEAPSRVRAPRRKPAVMSSAPEDHPRPVEAAPTPAS